MGREEVVAVIGLVLGLLCLVQHGEAQAQPPSLPLPMLRVADMPPLSPTVITAGGQRRLLNDVEVEIRFDASQQRLFVTRPGWWLINYPLRRIRGFEEKSEEDIARLLFGQSLPALRNWYVQTPGSPGPEPSPPSVPAPIDLTPHPTLVVNTRHPRADDRNAGTVGAPLKTITAAVKRAHAGTVIHVYPGIYRESVTIEQSGTAERPICLEGIQDKDGSLPVISGNDLFPANAWKPVKGLTGVYRADLFTGRLGTVSAASRTLIERSLPAELQEGEFCFNHASQEFLTLRLNDGLSPQDGERQDGRIWRRLPTDADGFLDLGQAYGESAAHAVFWASTYVWVEPRHKATVWNPDYPEVISGRLMVEGSFRAARIS
jgi:hypothetical protein